MITNSPRNVLLVFDDNSQSRDGIAAKARVWGEHNNQPITVLSINHLSSDDDLEILIKNSLHEAKINPTDKVAVVSDGSSRTSNVERSSAFGKGFVDVLGALKGFQEDLQAKITPWVLLRSPWITEPTTIDDKTKPVTYKFLNDFLHNHFRNVPRDRNNDDVIKRRIEQALVIAPAEIVTAGKSEDNPGLFTPMQEQQFFAFLDKAFGAQAAA